MLESLEAISGIFVCVFGIGTTFATFTIWFGSKVIAIKKSKFVNALLAALVNSLMIYIITALFNILPVFNAETGFFVGLFLSFFVVRSIFHLPFGKALIVWVFNIIAQISAVFLCAILLIGGIRDLIQII
ncbi:MAG: hypothetical protein ACTSRG_26905 [Candidatus Helarchaeota archaeon]